MILYFLSHHFVIIHFNLPFQLSWASNLFLVYKYFVLSIELDLSVASFKPICMKIYIYGITSNL
jgi:hypothetical protein